MVWCLTGCKLTYIEVVGEVPVQFLDQYLMGFGFGETSTLAMTIS